MVTLIFLMGLCGYVWINILTLSPLRVGRGGGGGVHFMIPVNEVHEEREREREREREYAHCRVWMMIMEQNPMVLLQQRKSIFVQ